MAKDDDNPFGEPPSTDPFGRPISGGEPFASPQPADVGSAPPPPDPWTQGPAAPPGGYAQPPATGARVDGAIPALVLGIIGIVFCQILGPIAWVMGRNAERKVDASGGTLTGRGEATAGKILGIIGTVLLVLGILFLILVVIGLGAGSVESDGTSTTFEF